MRTLAVTVGIVLLSAVLVAQDRLVTIGFQAVDASGSYAPGYIETDVTGATIGPSRGMMSLPKHGFRTPVAMAGARHVAWLAGVVWGWRSSDCAVYLAVLDRRSYAARAVPNIVLPCNGTGRLVGDRRRPRVFLHTWAATGGAPGFIASIDESLAVRPLVVSTRLGTAFAYASDSDEIFATFLPPVQDRSLIIRVFNGSTGEERRSFSIPNALNVSTVQLVVTHDGRRLYLWANSNLLADPPIRAFDTGTGAELAASQPVHMSGTGDRFVLDERRNLVLVPTADRTPPYSYHLLAFDGLTLRLEGEVNPGGYSFSTVFQPLTAHGADTVYLLHDAHDAESRCTILLDAIDNTGVLRARGDVARLAGIVPPSMPMGAGCSTVGVILRRPDAPSNLSAAVTGRQVTLTWTDPGDTTDFELEAGFAPGRRDLGVRVGRVTTFAVDEVPSGTYYARARAINEIGASAPSNEVRVVVP